MGADAALGSAVVEIRDLEAGDEAAWRGLWAGYNAFYAATVPEATTAYTWSRTLDPKVPLLGRIACVDGQPVGFSLSVLHEGTWVRDPVCYLEDLFVDPQVRGQGVGRALIQDLVDLGHARGWARLYWHTRTDNPARRLYDSFLPADDFVRYRLDLK